MIKKAFHHIIRSKIYFNAIRILGKEKNKILPPIRIGNPLIPVIFTVHPSAKIICQGRINIFSFLGNKESVVFHLEKNARLEFDGDFNIGAGTKFHLAMGAHMKFGGGEKENSGITGESKIMAKQSLEIGKDFLAAWNVFITDCDWHQIGDRQAWKKTMIGNHVWVGPNTSILKGVNIGNNCIIAGHSIVTGNIDSSDNLLIAGNPAQKVRETENWCYKLRE